MGSLKNWLYLGVAISAVSIGSFVYMNQIDAVRWKEEVLLHDGRKFVAKREITFGGAHEIGQSPTPSVWKLTFAGPGDTSTTISFQSEDGEQPILVEFESGVAYIAVYLATGLAEYKHRCPSPPYLFYRYTGSNWKEIPLSAFPSKFSSANLSPYSDDLMRRIHQSGTITSAEVSMFLAGRHLLPARTRILRPHGDMTNHNTTNCPSRG